MVLTRFFDFVFSAIGLIVLCPVLLVLALIIKLSSKGPVFFVQKRVGKNGHDFNLFKFRTMYTDADRKGLLTVGGRDSRITNVGFFLRKYKMDELPQLLNVIRGDMSIVGPRPEVRRYVELYTHEQRKVLSVLPGITDNASIVFRNESDLLATADDPEKFYIQEIIPRKIDLNMRYINNPGLVSYFRIIGQTVVTSVKGG